MEGFNIRAPKGQKKNKRLGRGIGSGHGKTAGKGHKGQKARAGGGVRLGFEGGQMPLFRRIARRGFSNYPFKKVFQVVNVSDLNRFADGDTVTPASLGARGLARKKGVAVKILGGGELTKKLVVDGATVSSTAREKIVALGGEVRDQPANPTAQPRKARAKKPRKAAATHPRSTAATADSGISAAGNDEAK
jgi:large subunit ribosomal protein L15